MSSKDDKNKPSPDKSTAKAAPTISRRPRVPVAVAPATSSEKVSGTVKNSVKEEKPSVKSTKKAKTESKTTKTSKTKKDSAPLKNSKKKDSVKAEPKDVGSSVKKSVAKEKKATDSLKENSTTKKKKSTEIKEIPLAKKTETVPQKKASPVESKIVELYPKSEVPAFEKKKTNRRSVTNVSTGRKLATRRGTVVSEEIGASVTEKTSTLEKTPVFDSKPVETVVQPVESTRNTPFIPLASPPKISTEPVLLPDASVKQEAKEKKSPAKAKKKKKSVEIEYASATEKYFFEAFENMPRLSPGGIGTIRKRMEYIPRRAELNILEIGCGRGETALLLAQEFPQANIVAIDINPHFIAQLNENAKEMGVSDRLVGKIMSVHEMEFSQSQFDLIWADGSIYLTGFERALVDWKQYLRPKGLLICNDICWIERKIPQNVQNGVQRKFGPIVQSSEKIAFAREQDYELLDVFVQSYTDWVAGYYAPLGRNLDEMEKKYANDPEAMAVVQDLRIEIMIYERYFHYYGYLSYVFALN